MQIDITLSPAALSVLKTAAAFPDRFRPAIARGLDKGLELALGQTIAKRFTGKGPFLVADKRLGVVTGRLRSSLRRTAAVINGDEVRASVGSNVKYFGAHEFGFSGTVTVRAHTRVRLMTEDGKQVSSKAAARSKKQITGHESQVRAHSRRVNIPAREPMMTGLSEQSVLIGKMISAALLNAWKGK